MGWRRYAVRTGELQRLLGLASQGTTTTRIMTSAVMDPANPHWLVFAVHDDLPGHQGDGEVRMERIDLTGHELVDPLTIAEWRRRDAEDVSPTPEPGMQAILAERRRQEAEEGFTPAYDDATYPVTRVGDIATAARCYQANDPGVEGGRIWPWSMEWWKPRDTRRNLVKAGALYLSLAEWSQRRVQEVADQLVALDVLEQGDEPDPRPDDADPRVPFAGPLPIHPQGFVTLPKGQHGAHG